MYLFLFTGMSVNVGESMGVVTDIRIRDLEAELTQLKSSWIEPFVYDQVKKDLLQMTEAKETYQVRRDLTDLVLMVLLSWIGWVAGSLY